MNERMSKEQLLLVFESFIIEAGYAIISVENDETNKQFTNIKTIKDGKSFLFHSNIKKIAPAYFPNDDSVLRIQVGPIDMESTPENRENQISILVGITKQDNKNVISIWNAFYFTGHQTNRSCYLTISNIDDTFSDGKCITSYSGTPVYISTKERFNEVLDEFIEDNKM